MNKHSDRKENRIGVIVEEQNVNQKQDLNQTESVTEKKNKIMPAIVQMIEMEIIWYQNVCQVSNSQIEPRNWVVMEEKNIAIFHSAFCYANCQNSRSHNRDDEWEIFEDVEEFLQWRIPKVQC